MLSVLEYMCTPCPSYVKGMGYLFEAMGIQRRFRRCASAWEVHLQQTRATILAGMARCEQHRKAILLGAGLLHDLPLQELANQFEEVYLVDIVHPLSSRWRTWKYANVHRIRLDVTNTARQIYRIAEDDQYPLPREVPTSFLDDPRLDFTASVNLLSQLPCMPLAYLSSRKVHPKSAMDAYAKELIRNHLLWLSRLPGKVTLVSDFERIELDGTGKQIQTIGLLYGEKPNRKHEEWTWNLAPLGEVSPDRSYLRRVMGIHDWK